jgi:NH3-dependent NAD+ synthetase
VTVLDAKLDALRQELRAHGRVVVAFSGGADSAFLAAVATATLGSSAVHAVTAVSPSLAGAEREDCRRLAAEWGLRWTPVETAEMERAAYRVNDTDRCFHCKAELMDVVAPTTSATIGRGSERRRRAAPRSRSSPPGSRSRRSVTRRGASGCGRGTSRPRPAWPAACRTGRR